MEDVPKKAFITWYGLYKFGIMPMGLKNVQAIFMWTMINLFKDMLDQGIVVFLDDILIYKYHIRGTFQIIRESVCTPVKIRILLQAKEVQLPTMDHHLPRIRPLPRRTANK